MRSARRTPRTDGSDVSESASAFEPLTEGKRRRMSSAGGETEAMKKVGAPTQFLTVIQKHDMENISRTKGAMIRKNE